MYAYEFFVQITSDDDGQQIVIHADNVQDAWARLVAYVPYPFASVALNSSRERS